MDAQTSSTPATVLPLPPGASTPRNRQTRYAHIDALRAFAVLLVVVAHAGLGDIVPGGSGVTIFFGISGFIITHLILTEWRKTSAFLVSGFYARRAIKLAPPLIACIIAPTLIYSLWHQVDASQVISQLFFYYNWVHIYAAQEHVLPGSSVLWSLAIEEQFYVVFAIAWLLALRFARDPAGAMLKLAAAALLLAFLARILILCSPDPGATMSEGGSNRRIYYGSDARMDSIAIGVIAAIWMHYLTLRPQLTPRLRSLVASNWTLGLAAGIYIFSLVWRDPTFRDLARYPLQSLAAVLVVLHGLLRTAPASRISPLGWAERSRLIQTIGLASYSIYVIHFVIIVFLYPDLRTIKSLAPTSVALLSLLCVASGVGVYYTLERPVQRWRLRRAALT
ncbi:MAG: acyltransferase [Patulibacter sp.]